MSDNASNDIPGENPMQSAHFEIIDAIFKGQEHGVNELLQNVTKKNLPWILSSLIKADQAIHIGEVLNNNVFLSEWDVEAFDYFFCHNNEEKEIVNKGLIEQLKDTHFRNKPQIFLICLCSNTYNKYMLKEWDKFLKGIVAGANTAFFSDKGEKPLFRENQFKILWRYPILVSSLLYSLSTTNKANPEYELYTKVLGTIPAEHFESYKYMFEVISHITCRIAYAYTTFDNIPTEIREKLKKTVSEWMIRVSMNVNGHLLISERNGSQSLSTAIHKTVYDYFEGPPNVPLKQDLNVLNEVYRSRVMPLRELIQLFYNRWKREDAKDRFFKQAFHICDHFSFTLLPEAIVKLLLPPTAVGSAAGSWLLNLSDKDDFGSETEPQTLEMFARLLAQKVVSNDPLLPEDTVKPSNKRQNCFLLHFLKYSFSTLQVWASLRDPSAAVELLGSENLDKPNLFLQCIQHWSKGNMRLEYEVPSFSAASLTFQELHQVIDRSERLNTLCVYGAHLFSLEECKEAVTDLRSLQRLSDVQVLCAYSPLLPDKFSEYLCVERSWLDSVSENKWTHEKVQRLLTCCERINLLFNYVPKDVQKLISIMSTDDNRKKSILFDTFMRSCHDKLNNTDEVPIHLQKTLNIVKQRLKEVLSSLADESLTVEEAKKITELLRKGGWSMEQELNVLGESGVCQLSDEVELTLLENLVHGQENCLLLEGVQRLLFPPEHICTLEYFGFELYTVYKDTDLFSIKSKIENAPHFTGMTLKTLREYSLFVMSFFDEVSVIAMTRIFSVLADLKLFENVWKFFEQNPNFVGSDGMCTYNFIEQIDGYLARLGRNKADIVESFKFLSQFIVALLRSSSKSRSLKELIALLIKSPAINKQLLGDDREWSLFVESLVSLNGEMRVVEDVFKGKEDPYDAVVSLYEYAQKGFLYYYNLSTSEVSIAFSKEEIVEQLDNSNTLEFQLQLRFALRDDPTRFRDSEDGQSADSFLRDLENLLSTLDTLRHLHSVGHPKFPSAHLFVSKGKNPPPVTDLNTFTEVTCSDMKTLDKMQSNWAEELSLTTSNYPWLSLISTPLAREVSLALQMNNILKATLLLYPFLEKSNTSSADVLKFCNRDKCHKYENWLKYLIDATKSLTQRFPSPQTEDSQRFTACKVYSCEMDHDVWFALERIYGGDKIYPFQILWCETSTDSACLEGIILRSQYYKQFRFTIVRPELLPFPMQQRLLQFLLQCGDASNNMCFIECADSLVRSAHSVKVEMDYTKSLCPIQRDKVYCFCGEAGSGKTYQLHKFLKKETTSPEKCVVCRIIVSESFRIIDAVKSLQDASLQCVSEKNLVVAIRFSVGCYSAAERGKWQELFRMVNTVLFGVLRMRCVEDSVTGMLASIPDDICLTVLVELPPTEFLWDDFNRKLDILTVFPLLEAENVTKIDCREEHFDLGSDAVEVAKYLKAYEDKTIDSRFNDSYREDFDVLFMLDISGSMRKNNRLGICKYSILNLIEKMSPNDRVGLCTYNEEINNIWDMNFCSPGNLRSLKARLDTVEYMGGSLLYKAIHHGGQILLKCAMKDRLQYLVVLSDGASDGAYFADCLTFLRSEGENIRIIFMTIDVPKGFETTIRKLVVRSDADCLISTTDQTGKIAEAFGMVGQRMSVNEQIQRNAEDMKDCDVPRLIWKYMDPKSHPDWSRVHMKLWIKYMRRRCDILASSTRFDRNTDKPTYGSTTMSMMLLEAEHAVAKNHTQWTDRAHEHMIYRAEVIKSDDGKLDIDYTWSVIAMNQEKDDKWQTKCQLMETLQMVMPEKEDLRDSRVLESYLAYGIGAELENVEPCCNSKGRFFDFPLGHLPALRENRFVLTLDYLMKMLMINERVNCLAPCLIMGETGVSKTRVTEMLFKLKNSHKTTETHELSKMLINDDNINIDYEAILQNLCQWLRTPLVPLRGPPNVDSILSICTKKEVIRNQLGTALLQVLRDDPSLDPLKDLDIQCLQGLQDSANDPESICKVIDWLIGQNTVEKREDRKNWMFVVVNMHSAMTANEIVSIVDQAAGRARRLHEMGKELPNFLFHKRAQICIFFDEFNTSSCMGLLKEIIQDRTLKGKDLPLNLVPIAACNPYRAKKQVHDTERMNEQGTEWVSGHYNVRALPTSLESMVWDYGSLAPSQEEEFIRKRMSFEDLKLPEEDEQKLIVCVMTAHSTIRELAKTHTKELLSNVYPDMTSDETNVRGNSAVSLRDILRFFRLFHYFRKGINESIREILFGSTDTKSTMQECAILSIVLVYYLRLSVSPDRSKNFRDIFSQRMKELGFEIEKVMQRCFDNIIENTEFEDGVVETKSLQENIATILLSVSSRTPLIIKGPPGTSKTLAVQILCENAHGEFSKNKLYKALPAMNSIHYQCSRQSSSKEITEIFERAIKSQKSSNEHGSGQTVYFVFMDEAGLPEEERESLKVLHYYLESNTRRATEIGFVAITNQLLDAANSNRCNMLSRAKYDGDELKTLAEGCLSLNRSAESIPTSICVKGTGDVIHLKKLIHLLCDRFEMFISTFQSRFSQSPMSSPLDSSLPDDCADFFSLRDFMHLFKLLGRVLGSLEGTGRVLSITDLVESFQRNFNGLRPAAVKQLVSYFLSELLNVGPHLCRLINPVKLVQESRREANDSHGPPVSRYILVTDTTTSNGVLQEMKNLFSIHIIRLGLFNHSVNQEQMNALGEVCWSAGRGYLIGLVNTQSIHEGLYDLFNQHYKLVRQNKKTVLRTNIAVGSLSVACDISTDFGCIVFMSEVEVQAAPAAFLDRLEKYRITMRDVLHHYVTSHADTGNWKVLKRIVRPLYDTVVQMIDSVGKNSFYGLKENQSVESALISLLRRWEADENIISDIHRWRNLIKENTSLLQGDSTTENTVEDLMKLLHDENPVSAKNVSSLLFQVGQRELAQMLLSVAIPEKVVFRLPSELIPQYLQTENFCFDSHLSDNGAVSSKWMKEIIFTKHVSADFENKYRTRGKGVDVLDFSTISTETQLKSKLNDLLSTTKNLVVLYKLSRYGISQLNFCRHCIDLHCSDLPIQCKKVIIVVTISSSDTITLHTYDTLFNTDWKLSFLDSVGDSSILPWLRVAFDASSYAAQNGTPISMLQELRNCVMDTCAPLLVGSLKRNSHPCSHSGTKHISEREIVSILSSKITTGLTLADFVATKFSTLWDDDTTHTAHTKMNNTSRITGIQLHIRNIIKSQNESPLTGCLSHTFQLELNDLLSRELVFFLKEAVLAFNTFPIEESQKECAYLFFSILESIPGMELFKLGALNKSISLEQINMPYKCGFPFYHKVKNSVSHILSQGTLSEKTIDYNDGDATVDDWEDELKDAFNSLDSLQDPVAKVATKRLWNMRKNNKLFSIYLENFVADVFPGYSKYTRDYTKMWLKELLPKEYAIPMLHILSITKNETLSHFVSTVERISECLLPNPGSRITDTTIDFTSEEGQISYLFTLFQNTMNSEDIDSLSRWMTVAHRVFRVSAHGKLSKLSTSQLCAMKMWISIYVAEQLCHQPDSPNTKLYIPRTITPLLKRVYTKFCAHAGSEIDPSDVLRILEEEDSVNALFYLSRMQFISTQLTLRSICKVLKKPRWNPAFLSMAVTRVNNYLVDKDFSFDSFISFYCLANELPVILEVSEETESECEEYIPHWLTQEPQEMTEHEISLRVAFTLVRNWILIWCQDINATASFNMNHPNPNTDVNIISHIEEIMNFIETLCSNAMKLVTLSALKHLFIQCVVDLCRRTPDTRSSGMYGSCVSILIQDSQRGDEKSNFWIRLLGEKLQKSNIRTNEIKALKRKYVWLEGLLNRVLQTETTEKNPGPSLSSPHVPPFSPLPQSVFTIAKQLFPKEMNAIEIMKHMWILPLVIDMHSWAWANRNMSKLLEISTPTRRSKWVFLRVALAEAKKNCSPLTKLPELTDDCDTPQKLLNYRDEFGNETIGLLHSIALLFITAYQNIVLPFVRSNNVPCAKNVVDINDSIEGNEKILAEISMERRKAVTVLAVENMLENHRRYLELCGPIACILQPLSVFCCSHSLWYENCHIQKLIERELHNFIETRAMHIPESLWNEQQFLILPTTMDNSGLSDIRKKYELDFLSLNTFFHSLNLHGLRQLKLLMSRAQEEGSSVSTRLETIVRKWVETENSSTDGTVVNWLSEFIGLSNTDSCSIILSMRLGDANKVMLYVDQQIEEQAYIFADKPIDIKERIPQEVATVIKSILLSVPREQLLLLVSFLSDQGEKIERNARKTQEDHLLFSLLAGSFNSREKLFRQHPVLLTIESSLQKTINLAEQFSLLTCHYVSFLQCILSVLREMKSQETRKTSEVPANWWCQTEEESSKLDSPQEVFEMSGENMWDFLLSSSEEGVNEANTQREPHNLRRIRGQLALWLKNFDGKKSSMDAIHELLLQLPRDDQAPITIQAINTLDASRTKLIRYNGIIQTFGTSEVAPTSIDSREIQKALEYIRNAEKDHEKDISSINEFNTAEKYFTKLKTVLETLTPEIPPLSRDEQLNNLFDESDC